MALAYSRKVTYTLGDGYVVRSATADDTQIYVLSYDSDSADTGSRIYTLNKQGAVVSFVAVPHDVANVGLVKIGNGFAFASELSSGQMCIKVVNASGALTNTIALRYTPDPLSQDDRQFGLPLGLAYNDTTSRYTYLSGRYIPFSGQAFTRVSAAQIPVTGIEVSFVRLPVGIKTLVATAHAATQNWVADSGTSKTITVLDSQYGSAGETQPLGLEFSGTLAALAYSQGQLIVFDDDEIFFYGAEPPPPPVGPQPVRQVFTDFPSEERFDIVRGTGQSFEVIANNIQVLRQSAFDLIVISGTETLRQRLARIEVVPIWTVPGVDQGDKLFTHTGAANTEPSAVPTNRPVFTVEGVLTIGNVYRQMLVCSLDT